MSEIKTWQEQSTNIHPETLVVSVETIRLMQAEIDELRFKIAAIKGQEPVARYLCECAEGSLVQLLADLKRGENLYAAGAAPVPEGLIEALMEAAEILGELTPETAPPSHRWPLADELDGFAAMLAAAPKDAP